MHHLLSTALLIFVTSSVSRACIPTKTPQPGIPATPGTPSRDRSGRNWGIRCLRLVDIREEFLEHHGCKMAVEVFFCDNNVLVGRFHFHFEMLIVHVLMFHLSSPSSHLRKLRLETVDVVS
ncbi:hypothetical protein PRIPAC_78888 [Pristionchus pacificus]|uniref:Uncharacterized protein n=1 Tax=Pristionchus pacificus TaxID=54126 RepID=A0A2A6CPA1_PRIPA|nr:hypothetical protein PRIPAC_78888 [Pristionchus pacificus]|eukprot:PDM80045.1 hypothetical protein PRIPAC_32624 [Pristionchus pacificus]